MIRNAMFAVLIALAGCGVACGGANSASSESCQAAPTCGGDLSGSWQIDSECLSIDSPFEQPECQAAIRDVSVAVSGTVRYAASGTDSSAGTQTSNVSYQFAATERYSTPCLKALGFEGPSADACHGLELLWSGAVSVSCAPQAEACQCDSADAQTNTESEAFTLAGHQIVTDGEDPVDYCRSGNRLVESASTGASRALITLHLQTP